MTREEQIREVAEEYSAYKDSVDEEEFYNSTELEAFMDGAKWADNHPAKKQVSTIDAWVARDKRFLWLSAEKPYKYKDEWWVKFMYYLDYNDFPSVTFENSPKKVKITIELEEDNEKL